VFLQFGVEGLPVGAASLLSDTESKGWTISHSTFGLGGPAPFNLQGETYQLAHNMFWNSPLTVPKNLNSDRNHFYTSQPETPIAQTNAESTFTTIAQVTKATGQEKNSIIATPAFATVPVCQITADPHDDNQLNHLILQRNGAPVNIKQFAKGDNIEINGDGILRRLTVIGKDHIDFEPALPMLPTRNLLIWNWKQATSATLNLMAADPKTAPANAPVQQTGSTIDLAACQRGELSGDAKRSIPELPEDVKVSLPNTNKIIPPFRLR
jgi:hypothetical protein